MADSWPELHPDYIAAATLDGAFLMLWNYFSPSSGKRATALKQRLDTAFPNFGRNCRPSALTIQFKLHDKVSEEPPMTALRHLYWLTVLRPIMVDASFMDDLRTVNVRSKDMFVTSEQRNEAVRLLQSSVDYWDVIYPMKTF